MIRLGLRLTLAGGRPAVVRLVLMAAGVAVGVTLVLAAAALPLGLVRSSERVVRDSPQEADELETKAPHLLWAVQHLEAPGAPHVTSIAVAESGPGAPAPLGARRTPAPGTVLVSPALARKLADRDARAELFPIPGRVVGRLADDALREPDELVLMTGWRYDELRAAAPGPTKLVSFDEIDGFAGLGVALATILTIPVVVLGGPLLLAPVLVFIGSTARVGARRRDARLAAMRLVGATPGQVRLAVAVEAVVAGALGAGAGVLLASGLRGLLASRGLLFASDYAVPAGIVALVVIVVPLLAGVSAVVALRRVELTPLGVIRRGRVRPVTRARWLPLVAGWALIAISIALPTPVAPIVATLGSVLVLVGLVRVGPRVLQQLAGVLGRVVRRPGALLAARRLEADPRAGFRPGSAVTLTVFIAMVLIVVISSADLSNGRSRASGPDGPAVRGPDLVVRGSASLFGPAGTDPELAAALAAVRGVEVAVPVYADLERFGEEPNRFVFRERVVVAECATFARVMRITGRIDCRAGALVPRSETPPGSLELTFHEPHGRDFAFTVPVTGRLAALDHDGLVETQGREHAAQLTRLGALVPPGLVPPDALASAEVTDVLLRTDGSTATARRIAGVLAARGPGLDVRSEIRRAELDLDGARDSARPLLYGPLLFMLLVAACSLCVTTVDTVFERRRAFATLRAVGAPAATLRAAVALETAAPLAIAAGLGLVNGLVAGVLSAYAFDEPMALPWADIGALAAIVFASWLVVATVVMGTVRRVAATASLRTA